MSIPLRPTLLVLTLLSLPCCVSQVRGEGQDNAKSEESDELQVPKDRVRAIRKTYADVPSDILGLKEPIQVKRADYYFDGGTLSFTLEDADGKVLDACLSMEGSKSRASRYLYSQVHLGAKYFTEPSARKVALRGPEESALYGIFIRARKEYRKEKNNKDPSAKWTSCYPRIMRALDLRYGYVSEDWNPKEDKEPKAQGRPER